MVTLYAHRNNGITTLKDKEGKTKAIFPNRVKQPRKGTKILTVNCWKYLIDWSNVEERVKGRSYLIQK